MIKYKFGTEKKVIYLEIFNQNDIKGEKQISRSIKKKMRKKEEIKESDREGRMLKSSL